MLTIHSKENPKNIYFYRSAILLKQNLKEIHRITSVAKLELKRYFIKIYIIFLY